MQIVLSLVKHGSDIDNNIDEANQNMNHIPKMGLPSSVDFHNSILSSMQEAAGLKDTGLKVQAICFIADSGTSQAKHAYPNRENHIDLTNSV